MDWFHRLAGLYLILQAFSTFNFKVSSSVAFLGLSSVSWLILLMCSWVTCTREDPILTKSYFNRCIRLELDNLLILTVKRKINFETSNALISVLNILWQVIFVVFISLDINECALSPPKCKANEVCFNFIGTFECRGTITIFCITFYILPYIQSQSISF